MSVNIWPTGYCLEPLAKSHPRRFFQSGAAEVDEWLQSKALQQQQKHLSTTKVLLDADKLIAGYYTLAAGQVDFGELPHDLVKRLPRRQLPVAVLAWLGIHNAHQGRGLGRRLLAQALSDCFEAGRTLAFVAVVLDCIDTRSKAFYLKFGFGEMPGQSLRLFLSVDRLNTIVARLSA